MLIFMLQRSTLLAPQFTTALALQHHHADDRHRNNRLLINILNEILSRQLCLFHEK